MSLEGTLARIELLRGPVAAPPPAPAPSSPQTAAGAATAGPAATPFAHQLQAMLGGAQASVAPFGTAPVAAGLPLAGGAGLTGGAGARALAAAQRELGVAEAPPGSNDAPRIAQYRQATAGAPGPGPWCAYFVSWAAKQAGTPLGEQGQGFGAVSQVWDWAQRSGRAVPAGGRPQAGDIIVWGGRHIGIVESVAADGRITTVEGNSSDRVSRRTYGPDGGGATGYVRLR